MHLLSSLFYLSVASTSLALVSAPLGERALGDSCSALEGSGTCQKTSDCTSQGFNVAGRCPGASDIQCCIKKTCATPSGSGICQDKGDNACSGSYVSGYCPGASSIECCVSGGGSGPSPPSGGSGSGIVSAAVKEEGLPYVWGGGGCDGPSGGGFDCSGLTQYSICQSLNKNIPRNTNTQYHSTMGKHIPRSEAQAGDLIFWGKNGDCNTAGAVEHVGIFMKPGLMVNAAHTGTPVREQPIWGSSGGLSLCPDAVRFW